MKKMETSIKGKSKEETTAKPLSKNQSSQVKSGGLIGKFDQVDRAVSGLLHSCVVKPQFLEFIILPFAYLF